MRLTFKKAFGLQFLATELFVWLVEIGKERFEITVNGSRIRLNAGSVGETDAERRLLAGFGTAGELGAPIRTIDITWEIDAGVGDDGEAPAEQGGRH